MNVDIMATTAPRSDQMNADDLLGGAQTFTIRAVEPGTSEQPVNIYLNEFDEGRPWKPSKTMRRVLMFAWGRDTDAYIGRRITLYRDAAVKFGGSEVGGIKISHLSHLAEPIKLALTAAKGKKAQHVVEPLAEAAPASPAVLPLGEEEVIAIQEHAEQAGIAVPDLLGVVSQEFGRRVGSLAELSADEARLTLGYLASRISS